MSTLLSITEGRTCIGHLLNRGPDGVEAFTPDAQSIGVFRNVQAAATAVWQFAHNQQINAEKQRSL